MGVFVPRLVVFLILQISFKVEICLASSGRTSDGGALYKKKNGNRLQLGEMRKCYSILV